MIPIKFVNANKHIMKYKSNELWVYSDGKQCISCWKMSWWQRIKALLFGKVWVFILSGDTQPPISLEVENTVWK